MASKLARVIKQKKPFRSLEQEAHLLLERTANALEERVAALLKPYGITGSQYNVLRILRGAGPKGLKCGGVAERMVTRDPDITRLLDRLERQGLVRRSRDSEDRRVVTTRITEKGLGILAGLDEPMAELHEQQLGHLGQERLRELISLLERTLP